MRSRAVPLFASFCVFGAFSFVGSAHATPAPRTTPPAVAKKVEVSVDESDPRIIEARRMQKLEDDLGALVERDPKTYTALVAVTPTTYQVLVPRGTDLAAAGRAVAAVVERSGRPADSASVAVVRRSRAELLALNDRVTALLDEMVAAGVDLNGAGPDYRLGKIQIDLVSGQAAAEKVLGPLVGDVHFVPSKVTRTTGSARAMLTAPAPRSCARR